MGMMLLTPIIILLVEAKARSIIRCPEAGPGLEAGVNEPAWAEGAVWVVFSGLADISVLLADSGFIN
jgi:hypothetical protein